MKGISKLEAGDGFGELALINDNTRGATIITNEVTDLIVINREIFQKYIKDVKSGLTNKILIIFEILTEF